MQVETLAQLGSVFLLFVHGLEFPLQDVSAFRRVAIGGTFADVGITITRSRAQLSKDH